MPHAARPKGGGYSSPARTRAAVREAVAEVAARDRAATAAFIGGDAA